MRAATHGAILIISHQERILQIADEIILLADGCVKRHGPREEILPELLGTANAAGACSMLDREG